MLIELIELANGGEDQSIGGALHHIAFKVDDLDKAEKELRAGGVRFRGAMDGENLKGDPLRAREEPSLFSVPASTAGLLLQFVERRSAAAGHAES